MKTIKGFVKKYWITVLIFAGLVLLYHYVADVKMLNPYLFPTTEKIAAAFESNKEVMLTNMLASFKLLIPSVFLSLVIAVIFGTIMGLNKKIREALHPVIYAFSVIPSILLSPFVRCCHQHYYQLPYFWLYIILSGQHYLLQITGS